MNSIIIVGNLTHDPELQVVGDVEKCSFRVAVNRKFKDKNGEKQTDFLQVVTWRKIAEICSKFLEKGKKVLVQGELQLRNWETKEGEKRTAVEIVAEEVEFLSPATENKKIAVEPKQTEFEFVKQDNNIVLPF